MKKVFAILLTALIVPVMSAFAAEVTATLPAFKVTFNDVVVENSSRQFPLIVYKDITYVPMTYFDCRYLGLSTDWNGETNTLAIEKNQITCAYRNYEWEWENAKKNKATICNFNIVVNGKEIDNLKEEYPLITFRDVTYFPLTWRFAVDEFGWEYSFDDENGLVIASDNPHSEVIFLKDVSYSSANNWQGGSVATDGSYYYYQGKDGKRDVVYRSLISGETLPEVIFELPKPYNITVGFLEDNGNLYFRYFAGGSAVTGNTYVYRILSDGTVNEEYPDTYFYSKHANTWFTLKNNGISVKGTYPYLQAPVEITYEINGIETKAALLPERFSIDRWRNGKDLYVSNNECIKIFGDKIYITATEAEGAENSNLYVIDTKTGKQAKLLDGVCGFHVYNGWVDELGCDSTMIIYDNNGILMRYTEINGDIRKIEDEGEEGLVLYAAVGSQTIYTLQKTVSGDKTVVKAFDCYANGRGSRKGKVFETATGTFYKEFTDKLCVYTHGESADDAVRLFVADEKGNHYRFSDAVRSVFIHKDTLLYTNNEAAVKVNLK